VTGYEYGNTRLRFMRRRLLRPADYRRLLGAQSLDRMLGELADTPFASDVEGALPRGEGLARLDAALSANLARSLRSMYSFYTGHPAERVSLLLDRWDLANLLALLRLPDAPGDPGDVSRLLVPAGRLDDAALAALGAQPDVMSRIDLVVTWGLLPPESSRFLTRAGAEYATSGDLAPVEQAATQAYADRITEVLGDSTAAAAAVLRSEIDAANLLLALRRREARRASEQLPATDGSSYLRGGVLRIGMWEEIEHLKDADQVAALLTALPTLPGWDEAIDTWAADGQLTDLVDRLQRATTQAATRRFTTGDPLTFDIPLVYSFAKEAEVRNLRLVGRALVHGLPSDLVLPRIEVAA